MSTENTSSKKFLIIGSGEMGGVFHTLLSNKSFFVRMWNRTPGKIPDQKPFEEEVQMADVIFFCVPTKAIPEVLQQIQSVLVPTKLLIFISKSIDPHTLLTVDQTVESVVSADQQFTLLYGPMIAEEIINGQSGFGIVATKNTVVFDFLRDVFDGTLLKLSYSNDVHSVAVAGVLKNVYALALGIADGLGWGCNARGWVTSQALSEMKKCMGALGGSEDVVFSLAGVGDLVATGLSTCSQNHEVGKQLVTGNLQLQSEGTRSLPSLKKMIGALFDHLPLLQGLHQIVEEKADAKKVFHDLIEMRERAL